MAQDMEIDMDQQRTDVFLSDLLQEHEISKSLFFFVHATDQHNKNVAREEYYKRIGNYDLCQIPNYKMYSFSPNLQILLKFILREIRSERENGTEGRLIIKSDNIKYHHGRFKSPEFKMYLDENKATNGKNAIPDLIDLLKEIIKSCGLEEEDDKVDDKKPPEVWSFFRALKDKKIRKKEFCFLEHHFSLWDAEKRMEFYMTFSGKIDSIDKSFVKYMVKNYNHKILEYIPPESILRKVMDTKSTVDSSSAANYTNAVPYFPRLARNIYGHYGEHKVNLRELDQEIAQTFPFVLNFFCTMLYQIGALNKFL